MAHFLTKRTQSSQAQALHKQLDLFSALPLRMIPHPKQSKIRQENEELSKKGMESQ